MATQTKTAIYLRQSLDQKGDELAISRQRSACRELCGSHGWSELVEYIDNDRSATTGKRPAYQQLLADIETGLVDRVVVWDLDRLHRRPIELEHFIDLSERHDVDLASVTGQHNLATVAGRGMARMMGAVARMEGEHKAERQVESHKQRVAAGKQWGPRAFGYEDGNMIIREPEAKPLRDAYRAVLQGVGLRGIATEWNAAGITTSTGGVWRSVQIRRTLMNPRYAGLVSRNGVVEEGVTAQWPSIVDADLWRSVNTILADPSRVTNKSAEGRKYLMSGLAVCGLCGHPMTSGQTGKRKRADGSMSDESPTTYLCRNAQCRKISRNQKHVDELVAGLVCGRLSRPDATELLITEKRSDVAALQDRAATLRARLDSVAVEFADGVLTASQLRAVTERLRSQLADIDSQVSDASRVRVFDGMIGAPDVRAVWDGLPLGRRRAVVDALLTVTILPVDRGPGFKPDSVAYVWKN